MEKIKKIALVGQPNVGKSVVFGRMTGKYAIVSNYPGTTVEVSRANLTIDGATYEVIDTPGVNGLVPQSEDERVTRDLLVRERPDVIVQVGDAKNIRRALHLTLQLAEFGIPLILDLNMMDECRARGIFIDKQAISDAFGIHVHETVATMGAGVHQLVQMIPKARPPRIPIDFHLPLLEKIRRILPPHFPPALCVEWVSDGEGVASGSCVACMGALLTAQLHHAIGDDHPLVRVDPSTYFDRERNRFLDGFVGKVKIDEGARVVLGSAGWYSFWLFLFAAGLVVYVSNFVLPLLGANNLLDVMGGWWATSTVGDGLWFGREGLLAGAFGLLHPGGTILLGYIAPVVVPALVLLKKFPRFSAQVDRLSRQPVTGGLILLLNLSVVYVLVGRLGAQVVAGFLEQAVFGGVILPQVSGILQAIAPGAFVHDVLVGPYGLVSKGLTYSIAVVLPVVGAFFMAFGFMEDSGYLPRLSIMANRLFRVVGLNGKAVLPMVLGLGCGTMATMTTRILNSKRERLIATLLLALGIPCSAQLGVIMGIFAGISFGVVLTVVLVVCFQTLLVGFLAGRFFSGTPSDFILEIPPIRYPVWRNVLLKARLRVAWFLKEAVPLFLLGTLALFALDRFHVLSSIIWAGRPLVSGCLGLPPDAAQVFVMGFIRRDFGAAGLYDMVRGGAMDGNQTAVALIVLTLFIPCVANFFVIIKEQGANRALAILGFVVPFALATGAAVHFFLLWTGIRL